MVVLATSISTKTGKVLVSRQFVPISRARIEGLLAAFPKLLGGGSSGQQHTFIETASVRYLYHKIEDLYLVVITNKSSNIVEDLETLKILTKVVPEFCGPAVTEKGVVENGFELIFAFDEVVSLGYKESVTLEQIKTYTELDSHEERIHDMIQKNQEREAMEEAKRRMKEIDRDRKEREKMGLSGYSGLGSGGRNTSSSSSNTQGTYNNQAFIDKTEKTYSRPDPTPERKVRRGLQLGKKPQAQNLMEKLRDEGEMNVSQETEIGRESGAQSSSTAAPVRREAVELTNTEQIKIEFERDGALKQMTIIGEFILNITQENANRIQVQLKNDSNLQFRTHPFIDRNAFANQNSIVLAEANKAYPLNTPTSVLRWKFDSTREEDAPLCFRCWPSVSNGKTVLVTSEYELGKEKPYQLSDVTITFPIVGKSSPVINNISDGNHRYDTKSTQLYWNIPRITSENGRGSFQFEVEQWDNSGNTNWLFPITVNFSSKTTMASLEVVDVTDHNGNPIRYSTNSELVVHKFVVG